MQKVDFPSSLYCPNQFHMWAIYSQDADFSTLCKWVDLCTNLKLKHEISKKSLNLYNVDSN